MSGMSGALGGLGAAMGSIQGRAIGNAITGGVDRGGGSRGDTAQYLGNTFIGWDAGGLKLKFNEERAGRSGVGMEVESSGKRRRAINKLADVYGRAASQTGNMLGQLSPGMGALTDARVRAITTNRQRAMGTLRDELAQRRVAGSSFGVDRLAAAEREFADAEAAARAQSFMEELSIRADLINRQASYAAQKFGTFLNEMNLQAGLASGANEALNTASQVMAQMQMQLAAFDHYETAGFWTQNQALMGQSAGQAAGSVIEFGAMGGGWPGGGSDPDYSARFGNKYNSGGTASNAMV